MAAMLAVAVLAGLSFGGWKWWQWWESHRPREFAYQPEQQITVAVVAPPEAPRTEKDDDVPPLPLRIAFSFPAAPIELVGKPVTDVAFLSPAIKGARTAICSIFRSRRTGNGPRRIGSRPSAPALSSCPA